MRLALAAALALTAASSLHAQAAPATPDLGIAVPLPGNWTYAPVADGSEATFSDSSSQPQLWIRCARSTRQVMVSKPASGAAPFIDIWTSTATRSVPASFNPATNRLTINLWAYDQLYDAMAYSRGRFAVSVRGQAPLVVPPWEEVARVIEDCRV